MSRETGKRNGSPELVTLMGQAGYFRADLVAEHLKIAPATVRLWAKDEKVRSRIASHVRFVHWADAVVAFGLENAITLRVVTRDEAAAIARAARKVAS